MTNILFPTLHLSMPFISNPSDILAYLVRHYFYTPSNIYESFLDFEYTFSKRLAEFQEHPDDLKELVQMVFETYISFIFDSTIYTVNVDIEYIDNPINKNDQYKDFYNMSVDILLTIDNKTYSISPNINIDDKGNFEINFNDV